MSSTDDAPGVSVPQWTQAWSRDKGETRARKLLTATFGEEPHGVWSAPGCLTIIGEHTDYNNGLTLPTTIAHRAFVAARLRDDDTLRVVASRTEGVTGPGEVWEGTLNDITPANSEGWPAYATGVLWALQEHGFTGRGLDLAIESCVPLGAGLASSAAIQCAVAIAVDDLWKLSLTSDSGREELADVCIDGENLIAGAYTGGHAHHTILRCLPNEALLLDFRGQSPVATASPLYFPDYGLAMLVIDTTVRHDTTDGKFGERRAECQRAAHELGLNSLRDLHEDPARLGRLRELTDQTLRHRARHVYSENDRVMLVKEQLSGTGPAHERFIAVGQALARSHASLDADFEVSIPELNLATMAASQCGALGAAITGGGFGGSVVALVRRTHAERTAALPTGLTRTTARAPGAP